MTDSLQENLSLFEVNKQLLAELRVTANQQLQMLQQNDAILAELQKLTYLVNGYTSGGAPARAYQPDQFLVAYLALVGPALGNRISKENHEPAEVLKASILIARDLLEELNAYKQSPVAMQGSIESALANTQDPWDQAEEPGEEDPQT